MTSPTLARPAALRPAVRLLWLPLVIASLGAAMPAARAQNVWVLKNAANDQSTSPTIVNYSSISNFRSNTGGSNTVRTNGQGGSSDFSVNPSDGTFYYLDGDADVSGDKKLYSWPSLADWASNSNTSFYGTRANYGPVIGMSVYNSQLYVLEGDPKNAGTATLRTWSSFSSFTSGAAGTLVGSGTRGVGTGLGFEIGIDGSVYKLDSSDPYTSTAGTLYSWPTINDFLADTNVSSNGGNFNFFGGTDQIAGVSVAPEPSGMMLAGLGLAAFAGATWRRRRSAHSSPVGTLTNS